MCRNFLSEALSQHCACPNYPPRRRLNLLASAVGIAVFELRGLNASRRPAVCCVAVHVHRVTGSAPFEIASDRWLQFTQNRKLETLKGIVSASSDFFFSP